MRDVLVLALAVVTIAGCGGSTDGSNGGSGGSAATGGTGGSGGSTGAGGTDGVDVDAKCRAFCSDSSCGGGDPVECLADCTDLGRRECGSLFMDRVNCEAELSCNDTFRDCDPLADVWQQCFENTLPPPVEAACDIEYDEALQLPGSGRYEVSTLHMQASVPAGHADSLPFEVQICDRKLDWGHGVDGFSNYWPGDFSKCLYNDVDLTGGNLFLCDVPQSFFEVDDAWTVIDDQYGSGARDVDQRFAGCTNHDPADWPDLTGGYPDFPWRHPVGIEVAAGSVRVPCGFYTAANDQGGLGSIDARSGSVRIRYTVPTFAGF